MAFGEMTYKDLVIRYGKQGAFDVLITIEKAAKLKTNLMVLDEETRWAKALETLDPSS